MGARSNNRLLDLLLLNHATAFEFPGMEEGAYAVRITLDVEECDEGQWVLIRYAAPFPYGTDPYMLVEYSTMDSPNSPSGQFWHPWSPTEDLPGLVYPVRFNDVREAALSALELVNGELVCSDIDHREKS